LFEVGLLGAGIASLSVCCQFGRAIFSLLTLILEKGNAFRESHFPCGMAMDFKPRMSANER